jgi:isopenicillin-N epimerase
MHDPGSRQALWMLDPAWTFLNHGSFGACPRPVVEAQQRLHEKLEAQPLLFLHREYEAHLDAARQDLASFLCCDGDGLVQVTNATTGVNTVLRSLSFTPSDELLVTDHEYNACRNALDEVAERSGATVVPVAVPFPLGSEDEVVRAILARVTDRTRLALVDHVTSATGLVLPVDRIVRELSRSGVDVLVDGAHAPGMLPLNLRELGAAFYTGNCHKWLCAPRGAAFLWVREDWRELIHPLVTSHGRNSLRRDRSRFLLEFDWTGTWDPTPFLCVPHAIRFLESLLPGGMPALQHANRELCLRARRLLCDALRIEAPCPEAMLGSMAAVPLPDVTGPAPRSPLFLDELQTSLAEHQGIEVPVIHWPAFPHRLLRVSAQIYNEIGQYEVLARVLASRNWCGGSAS